MTNQQQDAASAIEVWKQAEARARELEARLTNALQAYECKLGAEPDAQLFAEVALYRAVANERLTAVLRAMKAQAQALGPQA